MKAETLVAAAALGAAVLYVAAKRKPGESMGAAAGRVVVGAAADAGVGAVKAIGEQVGIPDTNTTQCDRDLAAGDMWAASFSCPASRWATGWGRTSINAAAIDDARQIDRIMDRQAAEANAKRENLGVVVNPETGAPQEAYDALGNRIF